MEIIETITTVIKIVAVVAFFIFCAWAGLMTPKWKRAAAQRQHDKNIEAQLRQDMRDTETRKKIAAKILRERGQTP